MNKEELKEKIRKQILMGGGETLVDAIYLILENQREKEYQRGFIAGADSTATQDKEIYDCKLKEIYEKIEGIKKQCEGCGGNTVWLNEVLKLLKY